MFLSKFVKHSKRKISKSSEALQTVQTQQETLHDSINQMKTPVEHRKFDVEHDIRTLL